MEIRAKGKTAFADPDAFGAPGNLAAAAAIFVTHYHFDYVDTDAVARLLAMKPLPVYGPKALADAVDFPARVVKSDAFGQPICK